MPIINNDGKVSVVYQIPPEIKQKISDYFYIAFAGELHSVFGPMISEKDEYDIYGLSYVGGTAGWEAAFKATCNKLQMQWLLDYYITLEWYDSDLFDSEMEDAIIKTVYEADDTSANSYYLHLIDEGEMTQMDYYEILDEQM